MCLVVLYNFAGKGHMSLDYYKVLNSHHEGSMEAPRSAHQTLVLGPLHTWVSEMPCVSLARVGHARLMCVLQC